MYRYLENDDLGTAKLIVEVYDNGNPAVLAEPDSVVIRRLTMCS